jgi:hypothetical protein
VVQVFLLAGRVATDTWSGTGTGVPVKKTEALL